MATGALTEVVAEELEQAAVVTRRISGASVTGFWIGFVPAFGIGFYVGYRYSKKKLRADIMAEADQEINEVRETYRQKVVAVEAQDKPSVEEIVKERGYVTREDLHERPLPPPVPINPHVHFPTSATIDPRPDPNVFRSDATQKDKDESWSYPLEMSKRGDFDPYVVHQDEFEAHESGFSQVTYIYYSGDNILVEEDNPGHILDNREALVGEEALNRFGHGSDDYNVVYVRNPHLELEFEICRVRGRWEQEVAGLNPDEPT